MALVVQKFGGTSVADPEARGRLAAKVEGELDRGNRVVVVVSAMGRAGAPYATDTLLGLVSGARASAALVRDLVASCGETISTCVVASLLEERGRPALPLTAYTAGLRAEGPFGDAEPTGIDAGRIRSLLEAGITPVIAGFQGVSPSGELLTLGRGGSDTSAVAVGAFLGADRVDIFTDVPGVAMADPRVVPDAPFLEGLDYRSMYRLALNGARVLHDRSALLGERHGVRIRVRSTFDEGEGTLVAPGAGDGRSLIGVAIAAGEAGSSRVTAIFRPGKGDRTAAAAAAARLGALAAPAEDPDVAAFSCPVASAKDLARALYAALSRDGD